MLACNLRTELGAGSKKLRRGNDNVRAEFEVLYSGYNQFRQRRYIATRSPLCNPVCTLVEYVRRLKFVFDELFE